MGAGQIAFLVLGIVLIIQFLVVQLSKLNITKQIIVTICSTSAVIAGIVFVSLGGC